MRETNNTYLWGTKMSNTSNYPIIPIIKLWYSSIKDKMTPFWVILDSYVGHSGRKILFVVNESIKNTPFFDSIVGHSSQTFTHSCKSYVDHIVPARLYRTSTKEENVPFSPIRNTKSSPDWLFPS